MFSPRIQPAWFPVLADGEDRANSTRAISGGACCPFSELISHFVPTYLGLYSCLSSTWEKEPVSHQKWVPVARKDPAPCPEMEGLANWPIANCKSKEDYWSFPRFLQDLACDPQFLRLLKGVPGQTA